VSVTGSEVRELQSDVQPARPPADKDPYGSVAEPELLIVLLAYVVVFGSIVGVLDWCCPGGSRATLVP